MFAPYPTKKETSQKYQQNYTTFNSIYATKQTIMLSVDKLNIYYYITEVLFDLVYRSIQNKKI